MRPRTVIPLLAATAVVAATVTSVVATAGHDRSAVQHAELTGRAVLPALTFGEQEPSGAAITAANGVTPPFDAQPVQGFSGLLRQRDGTYLVLSDNGYGQKANSADFLLRVHHLDVDFTTGGVEVLGGFGLSDPDHEISWPLTRPDRRLTGADFDVESFRKAPDGTFWFGDEFGPFLLHTDDTGRVLDAPVPLDGVRSPDDPTLPAGQMPTLGRSKGFEGMALSSNGRYLYPLLEGRIEGDHDQDLRAYRFDLKKQRYTGEAFRYRLEHPANAIGDLTAIDEHRFLVIERDNEQGAAARFKAIFLIDTRDRDRDGYADKEMLVNLMAVPDPQGIGGDGAFFRFPFQTIEGVEILDNHTIVIEDDNNFPFSSGRTPGQPDDNEFITVRLDAGLR